MDNECIKYDFWFINWLSKSSNNTPICSKNPKCLFVLSKQQEWRNDMQNQFERNKSTFYSQTESFSRVISPIAAYQPEEISGLVETIKDGCYFFVNYVPEPTNCTHKTTKLAVRSDHCIIKLWKAVKNRDFQNQILIM